MSYKLSVEIDAQNRTLVQKVGASRESVANLNHELGKAKGAGQQAAAGYSETEKAAGKLNNQSKHTGKSLSKVGNLANQAGYQISDMAVQLQMGTNAFVVLGQQGGQFLQAINPLAGAALAIAAAVAGVLAPSLFESSESVKSLTDALTDLNETSIRTEDGLLALSERILELAKRSEGLARIEIAKGIQDAEGVITSAVTNISKSLRESTEITSFGLLADASNAYDALGVSVTQYAEQGSDAVQLFIDTFEGSAADLSGALNSFREHSRIVQGGINELHRELGIGKERAAGFIDSLGEFERNPSAVTAKRLQNAVEGINEATSYSNKEFIAFASTLTASFQAISTATDKSNALKMALADLKTALSKSAESSSKLDQKILDTMVRQVALYGETSQAAKMRYETEHGALKDLTDLQKAQLIALSQTLDVKKEEADATREQERELARLLNVLDPTTAATKRLGEQQALLEAYFERTKVPIEQQQMLLKNLKELYKELPEPPKGPSDYDKLRGRLDPSFTEKQNHDQNMGLLNAELANTPEDQVAKRSQINALIEAEQTRHVEELNRIHQGAATEYDRVWTNAFDRFAEGVGDATADAIFESENFGQAMQNVARGALKSVVSGLVEVGVQQAMLAAKSSAIQKAAAADSTATAATTATAITGSMTAPATMTSVATMGSGTAAGTAALLAAIAMIPMMINMMGVAHDGIGRVPGSHEGTWMLRKDEMVLNPTQRENFEVLVNYAKSNPNQQQAAGSQSLQIEINNEYHIDASGAAEGTEEEIRLLLEQASQKMKADFYKDLQSGRLAGLIKSNYRS